MTLLAMFLPLPGGTFYSPHAKEFTCSHFISLNERGGGLYEDRDSNWSQLLTWYVFTLTWLVSRGQSGATYCSHLPLFIFCS